MHFGLSKLSDDIVYVFIYFFHFNFVTLPTPYSYYGCMVLKCLKNILCIFRLLLNKTMWLNW